MWRKGKEFVVPGMADNLFSLSFWVLLFYTILRLGRFFQDINDGSFSDNL